MKQYECKKKKKEANLLLLYKVRFVRKRIFCCMQPKRKKKNVTETKNISERCNIVLIYYINIRFV